MRFIGEGKQDLGGAAAPPCQKLTDILNRTQFERAVLYFCLQRNTSDLP